MQPDTTANKLAETLLEAIHEKFIKKKTDETEEENDDDEEDTKNENDPLLEKGAHALISQRKIRYYKARLFFCCLGIGNYVR